MSHLLNQAKNIHFIGIGGSGMSGLARILKAKGKNVTGSDQQDSHILRELQKEGILVHVGHKAENLKAEAQVVIYSPAVDEKNVERLEATKKLLTQLSYPEAVGLLTQEKKTIAVCGTHGKTTTAAMAAVSLIGTAEDPTVIIGASLKELDNRNERLGRGKYFVLEACEYQRGFLNYQPTIIILTNIEADHLDYYKDLKDYKEAFKQFIDKLPKDGLLIANYDDENVRDICKDFKKVPIKWYGKSEKAEYHFKGNAVYQNDKQILVLSLQVSGEHNVSNALAVVTLAANLKLDLFDVKSALESYTGASRRFEEKGRIGKTIIIDDYGHHPTEIKATLKAAREKFGADKKILCIFQPHQYNRTHKMLKEFAEAFSDADEVMIPNIFEARDSAADIKKVTPEMLVQKITENHQKSRYGKGLAETLAYAKKNADKFDVIITMGAGDVSKIANNLTK